MADPRAKALGRLIRAQRELQEMSLRKVASVAGISNPYLSQIERGLRAPSDKVLESIAASLDVSAETLRESAGIVPAAESDSRVSSAINEDPALTSAQKRALLEIYESFTAN